MQRCPICKVRLKAAEMSLPCRRCGNDLRIPHAIFEQAQRYYQQSMMCAAVHRYRAARALVTSAIRLHRHEDYLVWQQFLRQSGPDIP